MNKNLRVSDSFYDFLTKSDSRIARLLRRSINRSYYVPAYHLAVTTKYVNYLTLRDDGTISYLPAGKEHITNDAGKWARDNRQNGRPAVTIKKVLTPKAQALFTDKEYETFVNQYKARSAASKVGFVMRPNVDIGKVYDMDIKESGSLGNSCMNGDGRYMELYERCPHVRILTLVNGDNILYGRALVWNIKIGDKDAVFMDRIYVCEDMYYEMFLEYASKEGWYRRKKYASQECKKNWVYNGEEVEVSVRIMTTTEGLDYYPYIDTFTYGSDGWISNDYDGCQYEYTCTGGGRDGDGRLWCQYNEEYIHEDDAVWIERGMYRDGYIHRDYAVWCQTDQQYYYGCDGDIVEIGCDWYRKDDDDVVCVNGDWYLTDDDDITCVDGEYYRTDDDAILWSDFHDEYIIANDAVHSSHHDSWIKDDEAYEVAGEYFHESVVNKVA